jgi:asparagine synthase (glutamine-hydrolysing)
MDVDVNFYLSDCLLVKVDIATMAYGLEGRSPMLDHEFMAFAASLPADLKLRGDRSKYIFKQAVRGLLPADILDRPKKGFSVPLDAWFRQELRELTEDLLLDGRLARRGYFRPRIVERIVDEHLRGIASWEDQLWTLVRGARLRGSCWWGRGCWSGVRSYSSSPRAPPHDRRPAPH